MRIIAMSHSYAKKLYWAGSAGKWLIRALVANGIVVMPALAQGQEPTAPIIVTGKGLDDTPATPAYDNQTIERDQLLRAPSGRIEDVLGTVAGFQQFRRSDSRSSNPTGQGATLRSLGGNAASRTLVLLDGVPMADPFFGYIPYSAIAPERLSTVRVTRGGGAGAFGAGALTGTIDMASAGIDDLPMLSASSMVNNRAETELSGSLAPKLGNGFAVISGRWDRGKGFWTTPKDQRVPASARAKYDSWSAGIRGVTPVSETTELQVRGLIFDDHRTLRYKGANSTSSGEDASIRLIGRGNWQFDALAYIQARNFSSITLSSNTYTKVLDQRRTPSTGFGGKLELRPPVGAHQNLRFGIDFRGVKSTMLESPYNPISGLATAYRRAGGHNTDFGAFLEGDWSLGDVVLTAGARADRWTIRKGYYLETSAAGTITTDQTFANRSGTTGSFRGGVLWHVDDSITLRSAAYSSMRMPTLNELYRSYMVSPVLTRANANLSNERLIGYEAGLDVNTGPLHLALTVFDNRLKHAIANVTIGTNLDERQNIDRIRARGVELEAGVKHGDFSLDGSLALTRSRVKASGLAAAMNKLRPAQTPKIAANATFAWQPETGTKIAVSMNHMGAQFEDDLQSYVLPAVTTINAYAEVPLAPNVHFVLRGENLTDRHIITLNRAGTLDYGVPLTLWAGVRIGID